MPSSLIFNAALKLYVVVCLGVMRFDWVLLIQQLQHST